MLGDATRVKQMLTNLLSNAVKYNVDGGRVRVRHAPAATRGMVEIAVTDTGLGMSEASWPSCSSPSTGWAASAAASRAPASAWSSAAAWPS